MKLNKLFAGLIPLSLGVLFLTGCPPKQKLKVEEKPKEEAKVEAVTESTATAKSNDITINQEWADIPNLSVVNFGYDSSTLDDSARATLKKNVAIIKKLPASVTVRVEGHCDDRGTVEYNIALGQKRANAVSSFYSASGIGKSRIKTISFGEERPLCQEATDSCWAMNRRGATKVRNDSPISVSPDSLN